MSDTNSPAKDLFFIECKDPYGYWEDFSAHQRRCDCTPLE